MSHPKVTAPPTAFVSTAIPYVNAAPHLGHALEFVLADAVVATKRARGTDVWFTSGTDDNSSKNANAAVANGENTQTWVNRNAGHFERLLQQLSIRPSAFVRTSANPSHQASVHRLWQLCVDAGDVYPATYEGFYCVGCERFLRASEVPGDGCCPEHSTPLEVVVERNLFFRLSRYTDILNQKIQNNELRIVPDAARRETLALLDAGLEDISITRQVKLGRPSWGLTAPTWPDPDLPPQTIWVWFDALTNYLSSLDFGNNHERYRRYWVDATERVHVVGKGISRFHTIIWPALLSSAGIPLPTEVLVHGYLTIDAVKISKSGGNAVDPFRLIDEYGSDAIRYFLLRHVHPTKDGDFSEARLRTAYRAELANQFGNLLSRLTALVHIHCDDKVPSPDTMDATVSCVLEESRARVSNCQQHLGHHEAIATLFGALAQLNRYFDANAPWKLAKASTAGDATAEQSLRRVLGTTAFGLLQVAELLAPYLPIASERVCSALGYVESGTTFPSTSKRAFASSVQTGLRLFPK